jgi:type IV secretory pathway protease TraF
MSRYGILLSAVALTLSLAALPQRATGQDTDAGMAVKLLLYQEQKRSPFRAGLINAFAPPLGHAYARDWRRGLIPSALWYGGVLTCMVAGFQEPPRDGSDEAAATVCAAGAIAASVGYLWGIVGGARTANRHNALLRQRLDLDLEVSPGGFSLRLSAPW